MDYSKAKIYKLFASGVENMPYIGSTCNNLDQRLGQHKYAARADTQKKSASTVLFLENEDVEIKLIEDYPCETKEQLLARERHWIEQQDCLNKNIPGRTWQERWAEKREHNLLLHKQWVAANQEHIRAYAVGRREITREQERARNAAGYKEKRNAAKKEKAVCDVCHKEMNKNSLWTHKKSVHL
jgi:hypothetical protein